MNKPKESINQMQNITLAIAAFVGFVLVCLTKMEGWSYVTTVSIGAIVSTIIGMVWIASGVYLFAADKERLAKLGDQEVEQTKQKQTELEQVTALINKLEVRTKNLEEFIASGSNKIPAGILYTCIGCIAQVFVLGAQHFGL